MGPRKFAGLQLAFSRVQTIGWIEMALWTQQVNSVHGGTQTIGRAVNMQFSLFHFFQMVFEEIQFKQFQTLH